MASKQVWHCEHNVALQICESTKGQDGKEVFLKCLQHHVLMSLFKKKSLWPKEFFLKKLCNKGMEHVRNELQSYVNISEFCSTC